ncbi:membrane-associated protein, putative [Bodo saltans]|uniref:Membrane-associated protein, putative n=1 Tax=Bodo saltans TaxID=75058 RepID=A0A0S4JS75_BODSA|nr:membrane-associated protein, putative [Bodo saltans]|eukprot:CUG91942.1 membrane-associated protein, putative [Bodo saltans]
MFGALFNSYRKEEVGLLWLGGDVLFLPTVVSIASTTKPSASSRSAVCNSVMFAAAALLMVYALALACARPYRVGARNVFSPLVVLWGAVTCVLSCPLVTESLGASATNNALGSVSTLQSITVLFLAIANVVVFFTVDRVMTSLEWQDILSAKLQRLSAELLPLDDDNQLPLSLADKIIMKNDASITALNDYVVDDLFQDVAQDAAPDVMINGDDPFDSHFLNYFDGASSDEMVTLQPFGMVGASSAAHLGCSELVHMYGEMAREEDEPNDD